MKIKLLLLYIRMLERFRFMAIIGSGDPCPKLILGYRTCNKAYATPDGRPGVCDHSEASLKMAAGVRRGGQRLHIGL